MPDRLGEIRDRLHAHHNATAAIAADVGTKHDDRATLALHDHAAADIAWLVSEVERFYGCTWCGGRPVDSVYEEGVVPGDDAS